MMTSRERFYFKWKKYLKDLRYKTDEGFEGIIPMIHRLEKEGYKFPEYPSSKETAEWVKNILMYNTPTP